MQTHLSDLLELLLEPEQLVASSPSTRSSAVSYEAICALGFLIEGTVIKSRTVHPLHELALWPPCQAQNGYSKVSKTFAFPKLESWLRACLTTNPFGMTACLKSGKKLAWAQQGSLICRKNFPVLASLAARDLAGVWGFASFSSCCQWSGQSDSVEASLWD